jgi:NRPS condensation-like uncharacterized protein
MNFATRAVADQQIHYVVTFDGCLDEARLGKAVRLLMDAEPILGCRFVSGRRPFWHRRSDLDEVVLYRVVDHARAQDLRDFVTQPIDPAGDPQLQVRLFRNRTETLCLKVDHVAADAAGAKDALYLLARIYRSLGEDPAFRPVPNLSGSRGLAQATGRIPLKKKLAALRRRESLVPTWGFPVTRPGDTSGRTFSIRLIGSALFREIVTYGREHRATINDTLLAAFCRGCFALKAADDGVPLKVMVPVDLRRYIPSGRAEAVCNLSSAVFPVVASVPDEPFRDTLDRVKERMASYKSGYPGLGSAFFMDLAIRMGGARRVLTMARDIRERCIKSGKTSPMLSNFGIIDHKLLDFGHVAVTGAHGIGPVLFGPGFMLAVTGFADTLTLSAGFCSGCVSTEKVEALLDHMVMDLSTR